MGPNGKAGLLGRGALVAFYVMCLVGCRALQAAAAPDGGAAAGRRSLTQAQDAGYRFMRVHLDSTSLYRCAFDTPVIPK
jgi:hypothetical protein